MTRWGFTLSAALICAICATLPFVHLREMDTYAPLGFRTQVWVRDANTDASTAGLSEDIARYATSERVNVARDKADTDNAFYGRHLFVAVGDPTASTARWLVDGYPYFSRSAQTTVHPWAQLRFDETDPRGYYLLDGPSSAGSSLVAVFGRHGFEAVALPYLGPVSHAKGLIDGGRGVTALIGALAAAVLIGATVLMDAKRYGIGRLHGHGLRWMIASDTLGAAPAVGSVVAATCSIVALWLWTYNRFHQFGMYCAIAGSMALLAAAGAAATHALAVWLTGRTHILEAIKGRIPDRLTLASAYALRVPASLLAVMAVTSAVALAAPAQESNASLSTAQKRAGNSAYILLNGSLGKDTESLIMKATAHWLHQADLDHRIVIAEDSSRTYSTQTNVISLMTVNPTYFGQQVVLDKNRERILPDKVSNTRPTLFYPLNQKQNADQVVRIANQELDFARQLSGVKLVTPVAALPFQPNQALFTYGSALGEESGTLFNSFVLVVPPELGLWGPQYVDMAENIVLLQPGVPSDIAANPNLSAAILATLPVVQKMADDARTANLRWKTAVVNACGAISVLLAVVIASVSVYVRAWSVQIFVRFVHGWKRWHANPVLVFAETVILLGLLGYGSIPWLASLRQPGLVNQIAPPRQMVTQPTHLALMTVSVVIAAVGIAGATVTLRLRERSAILNRSTDRM